MPTRDVLLALITFSVFTGPILSGSAEGQGPVWAIAAFGLAAAAPLALRRRAPVPVLLLVSLALILAALGGIRFTPWVSNFGPALGIAVFTVAERYPRRTSLRLSTAAIACVAAAELVAYGLHPGTEQNAVHLLIGPAGWLLGHALRTRQGLDRQLHAERAERAAEAERRIRAEERLKISADVHDIVSHALSLIAVRSGVARMVLEQRPDEAKSALTAIEAASRSALDELREVLRTIRTGDEDEEPRRRTLADVPPLVQRLREDGMPIELAQPPGSKSSSLIEETAYRIVQEALTNVVRHAGRPATSVKIEHAWGSLQICVQNCPGEGPAIVAASSAAGAGSGLGLSGMRQRAELHGGTFEAEPLADGGFRVRVVLPDPPEPPEPGLLSSPDARHERARSPRAGER
ncbi:sensor histidine kinase [Kineosporia babensis]|uniref:histidine kinase n=1 Tax=Kineosporia babensis TaxID=499548 RepID=A0A9X1NH85_9ACTN|nr:histidine kinase [Kineosporia babensis]MCD5313829.1 histidine kinase [Kineosporia babensis]